MDSLIGYPFAGLNLGHEDPMGLYTFFIRNKLSGCSLDVS